MIKVGSTIFLELNDPEEEKRRYRSKVLDQEGEQIFVDFPVDDQTKKPHFFLEGTQFRAWFLGKDQAIYLFNTEVLGKAHRKIPMLILKDPGENKYHRIQRRKYVRINTSIDVAVHSLKGEFDPFTTVTSDISGGGMALILSNNHQLKVGQKVHVSLSIHFQTGDILYITTIAKAIRFIKDKGRVKGSFQFIDMKESDRQKIIRFCFEKQLGFRKNERQMS